MLSVKIIQGYKILWAFRPELGLFSNQFMRFLLYLLWIFKLKIAAVLRHCRVLMTMGPSWVSDLGGRIHFGSIRKKNSAFLERVRWIMPHRCIVRGCASIGDLWPEGIKRRENGWILRRWKDGWHDTDGSLGECDSEWISVSKQPIQEKGANISYHCQVFLLGRARLLWLASICQWMETKQLID